MKIYGFRSMPNGIIIDGVRHDSFGVFEISKRGAVMGKIAEFRSEQRAKDEIQKLHANDKLHSEIMSNANHSQL